MHAISSYRGNRPTHTNTHTHKPTHRQDRLQYTAPLASAQCNNTDYNTRNPKSNHKPKPNANPNERKENQTLKPKQHWQPK